MDYKERIKEIIADTLGIDIERITDDLAAGDIEEWNSVGNLTIISTIEEELEVDIPIEDLYELNNIKAIVEEIIKLKNE
ncbi:acyl carrier protein [Bacteroides uniformis]|uniref:acyl carrier protein n=1 Tax=Bacteroides uniformis TaxID=820 RepID=UPI001C377A12|nr:acyl carrier protein [Bacteroides uniformis]MBV3456256.1 acyl carrier protein [Bacteroides uniformis]MBV3481990.1 acyl carrier protein [Bacteroides uniformis]MBV3515128.1 acyl carrier protein [Bacteroides uniformis]